MSRSLYFVSYGDNDYKIQRNRIKFQARKFKIFEKIFIYNYKDLDMRFRKSYSQILKEDKGGGLWLWKSQIILQTLEKLKDDDVLLYLDSGSTLNIKGKDRLVEYFNILSNSNKDILLFRMPTIIEKNWTTKEVFQYFNVEENRDITDTLQCLGGIIFAKKTKGTIDFFKLFQKSVKDDPNLISNYYDKNQHKSFMEGRHDQSILSVMAKVRDYLMIDDESYFLAEADSPQNKEQLKYPILTVRDGKYNNWQKLKYYFLYPVNKRKVILFNQPPYYFKNKNTVYHRLIKIFLRKFRS